MYADPPGKAVPYRAAKTLFILLLNDKNNISESCSDGVKDRIIHNNVSVRVNGIDLLQSAVAASHSRSHDHKNRREYMEGLDDLVSQTWTVFTVTPSRLASCDWVM